MRMPHTGRRNTLPQMCIRDSFWETDHFFIEMEQPAPKRPKMKLEKWDGDIPVSYTHLDVYTRQASLYVKEIGTDEHYSLSGEKYPVVFEYAGQDVAKVEIGVNDGEAIENTLKRGRVSGWKVDQDGFELAGAKIGLFRFDETEFTEETALMVTESNEIGYFEFDKVPVGNWLVPVSYTHLRYRYCGF